MVRGSIGDCLEAVGVFEARGQSQEADGGDVHHLIKHALA
ncbi:hypothetical protein CLAFUW4_02909 [Fulvia fulva]|nr:uncharacterized protein CLAFUR5_20148 [Fulvia fulva]KAK4631868.1 hypothetical protein CLAFUR4_02902 [Fulvia fulva]KAK4633397.1 hypothetical protein CLAFUR0_02905 [Fulvia fulva]WMI38788.1 hypothetical protein CLAFUR5_20148 [Fulvia fulva]WPV10550.1 hypothetical protein CLAFUW4_02909 [Fulvia fulva]WPV26230.1 hypothetical protein CLAFUW7_02906 [Fulvia fulva]